MSDQKKTQAIYAVGDLHGMSYHLKNLLEMIYDDFRNGGFEYGEIVFTGDYVDRGPDSKGVLDILMAGSEIPELPFICLVGNHDDALFTAGKFWITRYAQATMRSFNVESSDDIDPKYREFIGRLWLKYESGPFFFCHAGVDPRRELTDQSRDDLLWIRHDFLNSTKDYGKIVVHGHTPSFGVMDIRPNRINVDSHCYKSGVLSAMKWDGESVSSLQFTSDVGVIKEGKAKNANHFKAVNDVFGSFESAES